MVNWAYPRCKRPFVPFGLVLICLLLDMGGSRNYVLSYSSTTLL